MHRQMRALDVTSAAVPVFEEMALDERSELEEDVELAPYSKFNHKQVVRNFAENYRNQLEGYLEELCSELQGEFRRSFNNGANVEEAVERVRNTFNDDAIRQRASLIAHMELHNARQTYRLSQLAEAENVVGVRASNVCRTDMAPVCRDLCGCEGEQAEAYFDRDETIGEQFTEGTSEEYLRQGFNPLPASPPFHFGCDTELEPIYADSEQ